VIFVPVVVLLWLLVVAVVEYVVLGLGLTDLRRLQRLGRLERLGFAQSVVLVLLQILITIEVLAYLINP
jgi:hypothetical protein